jgi:hypothetical protein
LLDQQAAVAVLHDQRYAWVPDDGATRLRAVREAHGVAGDAEVGGSSELLGAEERGGGSLFGRVSHADRPSVPGVRSMTIAISLQPGNFGQR